MKTVLIVDDKRVQLKTLGRGLRTRGYRASPMYRVYREAL
jgi:ActR/RegA family two-component response regulator